VVELAGPRREEPRASLVDFLAAERGHAEAWIALRSMTSLASGAPGAMPIAARYVAVASGRSRASVRSGVAWSRASRGGDRVCSRA